MKIFTLPGHTCEAGSIHRLVLMSGKILGQPALDQILQITAGRHPLRAVALVSQLVFVSPTSIRQTNIHYCDHLPCALDPAQFAIEALYSNKKDRGASALAVLTSSATNSWVSMLKQGATMTMEMWNADEKPNLTWSHPVGV